MEEHQLRKGIIYCIICNETSERYYGSTFKSIVERMRKHTSNSNTCSSKQIIERGNFTFQNLLECYVENKQQLHKIEADFIKNNICVNKVLPYRSEEEKKELKNKSARKYQRGDKFKIYTKNYYQIYNSKFTESIKCDCGGGWKYPRDKKKHLNTKRHNNWEASQQQKNTEVIDN